MSDSERYDLMIDEIDSLGKQSLQEQISQRNNSWHLYYINTHFRDIEKLKSEITALQGKLERGELVVVVRIVYYSQGTHTLQRRTEKDISKRSS